MENSIEENLWKIVKEYIEQFLDGPRQDTPGWHEARTKTIGGSEMATIQGVNPYCPISELICKKIGMGAEFKYPIFLQWGKIFEPVIMQWTEITYNTNIVGHDLFITGKYANQSYSPDGLTVLKISEDCTDAGELTGKPAIVLLEFKCPYIRRLTGKIPEYYMSQVKTGLDTIEIADIGLYIEGMFRRCSWEDLDDTPKYDRELWPRDAARDSAKPLARGFIIFYVMPENQNNERIQELNNMYDICGYCLEDIQDLGEFPKVIFEKIFDLAVKHHLLEVMYSSINCDAQAELDSFLEDSSGMGITIYGVLPWKLIRAERKYIKKEPGYVAKWQDKINEVIDVVNECNNQPERKHYLLQNYLAKNGAQ